MMFYFIRAFTQNQLDLAFPVCYDLKKDYTRIVCNLKHFNKKFYIETYLD